MNFWNFAHVRDREFFDFRHFFVTLTLDRFRPKSFGFVWWGIWTCRKKMEIISQAVRPVSCGQTNKKTKKQTNKKTHRQTRRLPYLRKSKISQVTNESARNERNLRNRIFWHHADARNAKVMHTRIERIICISCAKVICTFWTEPEVPSMSGSKVMLKTVFFTFFVTLTLTFDISG